MTDLLSPPRPSTRRWVAVGLVSITALSWIYLAFLSTQMGNMQSSFSMPMTTAWSRDEVALMATMWAVMMAGMMLPSASPMIAAYSKTIQSNTSGLHGSTPLFVGGYLVTWSGFAAAATGAQWVLHDLALVSAMGASTSKQFGGVLLLAAGAYQFSGIKEACLGKCRSPLGFLLNAWRPGPRGAFAMGLHHGALCIGCCWALMATLFVLGVMNLWWIAVVAAVVLLEKLVPSDIITKALGAALVIWGAVLLMP